MSNCFKCGDETPEGVLECLACSDGFSPAQTAHDHDADEAYFKANYMEVDWSRVETVADIVALLREVGMAQFVEKESPNFASLQKFLKPIED